MEFHETSLILNYVLACSRVYNPLRKTVSNKCMGTHIYIKSFGVKGYLARLRKIPSIMPFPAIVITLHTCYILVSIALTLLLLCNTFPRLGVLMGMGAFLGLFATKGPFALGLTSIGN